MQAAVDLAGDYRTYRLAALLSESFSLGELRGVSFQWQGERLFWERVSGWGLPCLPAER